MLATLAAIGDWLTPVLVVLFLMVCILMILIVLIQRPQGGGLSGAFGSGSGSGQSVFGAKTGDALTLATIAVFLLYLSVAVGLNWSIQPPSAQVEQAAQPAPGSDGAIEGETTDGAGAEGEAPAEEPIAEEAPLTDPETADGDFAEPPTPATPPETLPEGEVEAGAEEDAGSSSGGN